MTTPLERAAYEAGYARAVEDAKHISSAFDRAAYGELTPEQRRAGCTDAIAALRPPAPSEPREPSEPRATTANDVKCRICDYTEQQHATEPRACTSFRAATADGECRRCGGRGQYTGTVFRDVDCPDCGGTGRAGGGE